MINVGKINSPNKKVSLQTGLKFKINIDHVSTDQFMKSISTGMCI